MHTIDAQRRENESRRSGVLLFNRWRHRLSKLMVAPLVAGILLTTAENTARAQELTPGEHAAVQLIIQNIVLGGGGPISIGIDDHVSGRFGFKYGSSDHREGLEIVFQAGTEDVSLCFGTEDIQPGEIDIELNGIEIGEATSGENCITLSSSEMVAGENTINLVQTNPGERWGVYDISLRPLDILTLPRMTRSAWDEGAVRKVLKVFAFGGHATDTQIAAWAGSDPELAIAEMLNFSKHNTKLSPLASGEKYVEPATQHGTFAEFSEYLASNDSNLPMDLNTENNNFSRGRFGLSSYDREGAFFRMATTRGLNPFRQRIGMWETNYHLATNLDTSVDHRQMVRYYDDIMAAHEAGLPYKDVLAVAAKSAAVAMQYGHRRNVWINGECYCNDDFAREIHQLFFGILGAEDPESTPTYNHHEEVTIPQTARMLTDMQVDWDPSLNRYPDYVTFGTSEHHVAPLDILNTQITGADAAEKIDNLVNVSIEHPESLKNLPLIIIRGLADDNITAAKELAIQQAWEAMGDDKNLLDFVRAYAISDLFHSPEQRKYLTSIERIIYLANRTYLTNTESLLDRINFDSQFRGENVELFRPVHNVFGSQTSLEAANSSVIFENNYNRTTDDEYNYRRRGTECSDCDFGDPWLKDWGSVIPQINGVYRVDDVAMWLWNHVVGNLEDYTELERAHLVSILGGAEKKSDPNHQYHQNLYFDFNHLLCMRQEIIDTLGPGADVSIDWLLLEGWHRYCEPGPETDGGGEQIYSASELNLLTRVYSKSEIENTAYIQQMLSELGAEELPLDANPAHNQRRYANERVQAAISFIFTTPYIFVEERR